MHNGEHVRNLEEADQEELTAAIASANASANKSAAQLAAESFPCTVTDAVHAAATFSRQEGQARTRTLTVHSIRQPGRSL
jgi:enhancing lycopene biosynthesis protein 2